MSKKASQLGVGDLGEFLTILQPLAEMNKGKQYNILNIVSSCAKEFVTYVFIIFDKTIINYVLDKTNKEL